MGTDAWDALLDEALRHHAAVEPRPGFEARLQARVAEAAAPRTALRSWTVITAMVLVLVAALPWALRRPAISHDPPIQAVRMRNLETVEREVSPRLANRQVAHSSGRHMTRRVRLRSPRLTWAEATLLRLGREQPVASSQLGNELQQPLQDLTVVPLEVPPLAVPPLATAGGTSR